MPSTDLPYYIKNYEGFSFAKEIKLPFGKLDEAIAFCKQGKDDSWRWQLREPSSNNQPGSYIFYFNNEQDYCAFLMRWC